MYVRSEGKGYSGYQALILLRVVHVLFASYITDMDLANACLVVDKRSTVYPRKKSRKPVEIRQRTRPLVEVMIGPEDLRMVVVVVRTV